MSNLSRNPTAKNNTTDFVGPSWTRLTGQTVGTTGRTTAARYTAAASAYPNIGTAGAMLASSALTGGKTYSYVALVRSSVARNVDNFLSRYNGTSFVSAVGSSVRTALAANTWTLIRGTGTVPTGGTYDRIGVHTDLPTAAAGTFDIAAIRIVEGTDTTMTFADGDTSGWQWDGTNGNSTSSIAVVTPVPVVSAGADATLELGQTFTRTATETNSPTSRAWTIQSGPSAGTTIGTAAALSWTPSVAGTYVLRYSATNAGGTGTSDVTVTVNAPAGTTRVNYSVSPAFAVESSPTNWYGTGARATDLVGFARSTGFRNTGAGDVVTARWDCASGQLWATSVQIRLASAGTVTAGINFYDSVGFLTGTSEDFVIPANQVMQVGIAATTPATAVQAVMILVAPSAMEATAHLVERDTAEFGSWFDGDTPSASWDGAVGASTSRLVTATESSFEPGRYLLIG